MYRYMNVLVLYVPTYECICTIFTDILTYLYYMYRYTDIFVLYVLILIRTCSFRFVYPIYFPKPPQSALKPHSNYKKDLHFARTEPFRSSTLCRAGPHVRSHTKRGTTCLLCTKCKKGFIRSVLKCIIKSFSPDDNLLAVKSRNC